MEKETQMMQQKYEQDMKAMREEMQNKFQQILAKIDVAIVCSLIQKCRYIITIFDITR
jgi:hypothetical protein